jgi:hypothetical protein
MSQQLLLAACEQAERSEAAVRAAALMHIARVLARSDQAAAEQLLEQGVALAREVDGDATSLLLSNAISLAAAVSAKHALPLYAEYRRMDPFGGPVISLVNVMAGHGHIADAIAYLNDPLPGDRFPLHLVNNLEQECPDDESPRRLLELAIREWSNPAPRESPDKQFAAQAFTALFGRCWNLLPRDVATPVLKELVDWALFMKSEPGEYTLAGPGDPKIGLGARVPSLQTNPRAPEPRTGSGALPHRNSSSTRGGNEAVSVGDAVSLGRTEQIRSRSRRRGSDRGFGADADRRSASDRLRCGISVCSGELRGGLRRRVSE